MDKQKLVETIKSKCSFLCIGLDVDFDKIPPHLKAEPDPIFAFNKAIIEATADLCVAYKPNLAFYEALGTKGWDSLERAMGLIPEGIFTIADAKRGDIGNTSKMYAKAFFEDLDFDAVTVAPYMGSDSVSPFLSFKNKWVILLALTSNQGAEDFQFLEFGGKKLYEHVLVVSQQWGTPENMMYVVGATKAPHMAAIRKVIPDHFILVPGVGAQGGSLKEVCLNGMNQEVGLLINASRSILYASNGKNFAQAAREAALKIRDEMALYLTNIG